MLIDALSLLIKFILNFFKGVWNVLIIIVKLVINIFGYIYNFFVYIFFPKSKRDSIPKYKWKKLIEKG